MFHKKILSNNRIPRTVLLLSGVLLGYSLMAPSWAMEPVVEPEESKRPTAKGKSESKITKSKSKSKSQPESKSKSKSVLSLASSFSSKKDKSTKNPLDNPPLSESPRELKLKPESQVSPRAPKAGSTEPKLEPKSKSRSGSLIDFKRKSTEPTEPKPRSNSLAESKPKSPRVDKKQSSKPKKSKSQSTNNEYLLEKTIYSLEDLRKLKNVSFLSPGRHYFRLKIELERKEFETIIKEDRIEGVKQPLREHLIEKLVVLKANQDIDSRREREITQEKDELNRLTCEEFVESPRGEDLKRQTVPEKIDLESEALNKVALKTNLSLPFKEIFNSPAYGGLKEVHISRLPLGGSSVAVARLNDLLEGLQALVPLSIFTLNFCSLDDEGAEVLGPFLKKRRLQHVDLSCNKVGPRGILTILSCLTNRPQVSRGFEIKIDNTLESKATYEFLICETQDDFPLIKPEQLGLFAETPKLCCKIHNKKEIWVSSDPLENPVYSNEINKILEILQPIPSEKQESDSFQLPFEELEKEEYNYPKNKLLQCLSTVGYIPQAGLFAGDTSNLIKSLEGKGITVTFQAPVVFKD